MVVKYQMEDGEQGEAEQTAKSRAFVMQAGVGTEIGSGETESSILPHHK